MTTASTVYLRLRDDVRIIFSCIFIKLLNGFTGFVVIVEIDLSIQFQTNLLKNVIIKSKNENVMNVRIRVDPI